MAPKKSERLKEQLLRKDPTPSEAVYFTTGCTLLDLNIGGGQGMGHKGGTIVQAVAVNQGGKTQLYSESVAHNYHAKNKSGFWWDYIIRERRYSFDTKAQFGVEVASLDNPYPKTIEALDGHITMRVNAAKAPGMIVVDSLDAFSTEEMEDRSDAREALVKAGAEEVVLDGSYTTKTGIPAFFSESLRSLTPKLQETNTLLVLLSQVRTNMDAGKFSADKLTCNGGKALDHAIDTRLWLKPVRYLTVGNSKDGTERDIGVVVKAWTTKSSTPRPYRTCFYTILFAYGIDNIGSNLDFLFNLRDYEGKNIGELNKNANAIRWSGGEELTLPAAKRWMEAHSTEELDLMAEYQAHLKDVVGNKTFQIGERLDLWMDGHYPELYAKFYANFHPVTYEREALIAKIEADPDLEAELTRRVITKWEAIEAAALPVRKAKFGGAI